MSLTINDVLTRKVLTISPEIMLAEAAGLMSEHRISCLVAVESDKPVGIITEADMVQIAHQHIDLEQTCISGFLSAPVISIEKNQSVYDAFDLLLEHQLRHLVVIFPDGRLEGLLTFSDILKVAESDNFLREMEGQLLIDKTELERIIDATSRLITWQDQPADLLTLRDISERKLSEIRNVEFNRILEESLNEIYIFDADSLQFIQVNRGARLNLGYTPVECKKMTSLDLKPAFTRQTFLELMEPLSNGSVEKIIFNTTHKRKDGSLYPVEVNLQRSTFQARPVYVSLIQDITEREEHEQELLPMQTIIDQAEDCIYATDMDGRYILLNKASERLLKRSKD